MEMILKFYTAYSRGYSQNLRGFLDKSNISYEHIYIDEKTAAIQDLYKEGEEVTVSISGMDSERERISLSLVS